MLDNECTERAGGEMDISETNENDNTPNKRDATDQQSHYLTQTPTVPLKDAEEQEYPNSKSGGRQTDQRRN